MIFSSLGRIMDVIGRVVGSDAAEQVDVCGKLLHYALLKLPEREQARIKDEFSFSGSTLGGEDNDKLLREIRKSLKAEKLKQSSTPK